jgi:dimethylhistidine N-methyltransferase
MTDGSSPFVQEIVRDLQRTQARISPKFFYDKTGSTLFHRITTLEEYYPTRMERAILEKASEEIARSIGECWTVIEPGAGSCEKAEHLCRLLRPRSFVGVDISADYLADGVERLRGTLPGLSVHAVAGDLTEELLLPPDLPMPRRTVFFPGSSVGNFEPDEAVALLSRILRLLDSDGLLLLGVDLQKPIDVLEAAYNDSDGVTEAFNLNILNHVNRLIGGNFRAADWLHRAYFNKERSRIEMHLEARRATAVAWSGGRRRFKQGESIHTENSYKYSLESFRDLLERAGFDRSEVWTDDQGWYALFLARPGAARKSQRRIAS